VIDTVYLAYAGIALLVVVLVLVIVVLVRAASGRDLAALQTEVGTLSRENERLERELRDELARQRGAAAEAARAQREEHAGQLTRLGQGLGAQLAQMAQVQNNQLDGFAQSLTALTRTNEERFEHLRATVDQKLTQVSADQRVGREESANTLKRFGDGLAERLQLQTEANDKRLTELRGTVEERLKALQDDNAKKLDDMRQTVDEKLHKTLEDRLTQSFQQVSERLEQVHRGLGEMQTLAAGVGDLKRVLTNVKARGTWGEVQLGALLEQVMAPGQFERQVETRRGSRERVDFAVRLPGREGEQDVVYLPIDAKFPQEDYQRLIEAHERADLEALEESAKQLEARIKTQAKSIRDKYIEPPATTDFAVLFLPTEGLYAEVLRRPGLAEAIQRDQRVIVAGPTTLAALLNSLQMGFRTLAIEQRSSEVWALLGAVKTEFGKFGTVLAKTREKLDQASRTIGEAETRTRQITRKLKGVELLPGPEAAALLGSAEADDESAEADDREPRLPLQ
jgi:DNA recombination protein RmuC